MSPNDTLILLHHQAQLGLFPIRRRLDWLGYARPDTCIFGAASIARVLQDIRPYLSPWDQSLAEKIGQSILARYPHYAHPSRPGTFNFWDQHFPHGYFLHRFRHFQLPADIDDTALILSTGNFPKKHHELVYHTAQQHTEAGRRKNKWPIRPTFYRSVPQQELIYQTWFGVKMPLEFDVCALCNWMTWVVEQGFFGQSPSDQATVNFVLAVLNSSEWIDQAPQVARHYGRPAWIAYHAARWLSVAQGLEISLFLKVLENQLSYDPSPDQLLLHVAWYKLGGQPLPRLHVPAEAWDNFPLFLGDMLAPFGPFWAKQSWAKMYWTSPANGLALQLEYDIWLEQARVLHST